MKYCILSPLGLSLFTVPRLNAVSEVEKIYFYYPKLDDKSLGKDLNTLPDWNKLEMITDYNKALNECSKSELTIVIDDVSMGECGTQLAKEGWTVVGGKQITDKIEVERQFATDLMKRVMNVPESTSFQSWERARDFVRNFDKEERLVFKPNDADAPKEYTYVAKDTSDLLETMQQFKTAWRWKEDFQIQRFIKGIEVDFNIYFNGKDWLPNSMMLYFENKAFMNDDIGPATGGSIAVQFAHPLEGTFFDILNKLKPMLAKANYKGQIAVNSMVSEEDHKPYFLEFTARFGYPSLPMDITLLEANGKTVHQLYQALANGETTDLFPTDKIAAVVWVFVPPFPAKHGSEETRGKPIAWDKKYDAYFFPYSVMAEKGNIVLSGTSAEVLNVTCESENLDGVVQMLYEVYLPALKLQDKMYRTDCGKSAKERIKKLKEWKII